MLFNGILSHQSDGFTFISLRAGNIYCSVIYGDRLIILRAKAKKLRITARKGNDNQLNEACIRIKRRSSPIFTERQADKDWTE